ncbi:outer membrane lipoprotein carrier protein LolA [Deinococcus wulumuqiensis]|uniref:Outer membrane lipoprotein carrier protein LolA n=1 Tax=Deinococcus wulumuqiensis TaxID=980427 RepID=A0A345IFM5_9DEIO|nr:outer membrane lipoprotein carrier protein LolA [Deinococcus wulumuqiensis]AXG98497.1 outer membrane lipoprotein carrier protein LolA [Deinococcus wulumuqiensis]
MHKTLPFLLALTLGAASAQSAQDILNRVDSAQKNVKDLSFRLSGSASMDSGKQTIDLTVKAIPAQSLARIQFAAPDALADNVVVADRKEVRQYLFLTNQITVMPLDKATTQSGLGTFDFTKLSNPATLLAGYDVKLLGTSGRAGQRTFQLEAQAKGGSSKDSTRVWITEAGWRPTRVQLLSSGKTLADLTLSNYKTNSGLSAASLRQLPKSAQIVRP